MGGGAGLGLHSAVENDLIILSTLVYYVDAGEHLRKSLTRAATH